MVLALVVDNDDPGNYPIPCSEFRVTSHSGWASLPLNRESTFWEDSMVFEDKMHLPKGVFVYDTSSGHPTTIKKVSGMNLGKYSPVIVCPVDGKFYVMSRCMASHDFEKFDPELDSWDLLCIPPVPYRPFPDCPDEYCISAYTLTNDRKILMSTPSGLFSYVIDMDQYNWYSYPEVSIPFGPRFMQVDILTECAVSIGGDRFLGFIEEDDHRVLGTKRYNSTKHIWDDFQHIQEWRTKYKPFVNPMSLGDGLFCAVFSGYDLSPIRSGYDRDIGTHCVSIGVFGDGPNLKCLHSLRYEKEYDMFRCRKNILASCPL